MCIILHLEEVIEEQNNLILRRPSWPTKVRVEGRPDYRPSR
ncbi:2310_t:CDS:2 [Scutellospora calospora]|uniref:2310_t:CDS:1 n=1 Tax=Scutellospora calospora TaxID=85575 RepID=A0ACA9JVI3_9GLOM|nr:2310_t:CDS:2 [Scutellospora calospora]